MVQLQAGRPPFGFDTVQTEILKKRSVGKGNCSSSKCNRGYLHVLRGNGYEGIVQCKVPVLRKGSGIVNN